MGLSVKDSLMKIIDEEGLISFLADDVLDGVVKVKLDELVASSDNTLDDTLVTMLYPVVRAAVVDYLRSEAAKLQAPE